MLAPLTDVLAPGTPPMRGTWLDTSIYIAPFHLAVRELREKQCRRFQGYRLIAPSESGSAGTSSFPRIVRLGGVPAHAGAELCLCAIRPGVSLHITWSVCMDARIVTGIICEETHGDPADISFILRFGNARDAPRQKAIFPKRPRDDDKHLASARAREWAQRNLAVILERKVFVEPVPPAKARR